MFGAEGSNGPVHIIDFGGMTAPQILQHRNDVARRSEDLVDFLPEIDVERDALRRGDREAFVEHQLLERVEFRVGNAANLATEDGGDRIDDTIENGLVPHLCRDVSGHPALETGGGKQVRDSIATLMLLDDSVAPGHVFDLAGCFKNRAELGDAAENNAASA